MKIIKDKEGIFRFYYTDLLPNQYINFDSVDELKELSDLIEPYLELVGISKCDSCRYAP